MRLDNSNLRDNLGLPLVSVLMPAFNAADTIGEAIQSVLNQTYLNFELIIVDDGSTDATSEVIGRYADPRIRLIVQGNQGVGAALNAGLVEARGDFIARQDADDVSYPRRFELQVKYLMEHERTVMVGSQSQIAGARSALNIGHAHPTSNAKLQWEGLFRCLFVSSSVMFRRDVAVQLGGFQSALPEDFDLWSRLARMGELHNLDQRLVAYRESGGSLSSVRAREIDLGTEAVASRNVAHLLPRLPAADREWLVAVVRGRALPPTLALMEYARILRLIVKVTAALIVRFPTERVSLIIVGLSAVGSIFRRRFGLTAKNGLRAAQRKLGVRRE